MPTRPQRYRPHGDVHPARPAEPSSTARGYDSRWRRAAAAFLVLHPLCAECERQGIVTPATCVDHVIPHKGDAVLFWDSVGNWQAMCSRCHGVKTAQEDGGYGNPRK